MPLLATMLSRSAESTKPRGSRYIDWELLTDSTGARTTAFGWYAGYAGMVDGLSLLGVKMLARCGVASPLLRVPRPHQAVDGVEGIRRDLKLVGEQWRAEGGRKGLGPVVIVISGRGRVGNGARAVLEDVGVAWIKADQLKRVTEDPCESRQRNIFPSGSLSLNDLVIVVFSCRFEQDLCRSTRTQGLARPA